MKKKYLEKNIHLKKKKIKINIIIYNIGVLKRIINLLDDTTN